MEGQYWDGPCLSQLGVADCGRFFVRVGGLTLVGSLQTMGAQATVSMSDPHIRGSVCLRLSWGG